MIEGLVVGGVLVVLLMPVLLLAVLAVYGKRARHERYRAFLDKVLNETD